MNEKGIGCVREEFERPLEKNVTIFANKEYNFLECSHITSFWTITLLNE